MNRVNSDPMENEPYKLFPDMENHGVLLSILTAQIFTIISNISPTIIIPIYGYNPIDDEIANINFLIDTLCLSDCETFLINLKNTSEKKHTCYI